VVSLLVIFKKNLLLIF